jgi:mono/diheme cytochrome c family protein
LTEVPEHLLARSRARRAGAAAGGDAATPATTGDAAPAKAAEAAAPVAAEAPAPAKAEPKLPWVEAGESRRKIPVWAVSALVALPIWAVMYATTNDPQSPKEAGPLTTGATVYTACASCHGATGGGGVGPKLAGGDVIAAFPDPAQQLRWVMLGTAGYQAEGTPTYGEDKKPVGGIGVMPAQIDGLTSEQLLAVVRHERETLSGEKFDAAAWDKVAEELEADKNPKVAEKAKEFKEIIEGWKALPAGT